MNAKLFTLAIASATAVIGFLCGNYRANRSWERMRERQEYDGFRSRCQTRVWANLATLGKLSEDKHFDVRSQLHQELDMDILSLADLWSNNPSMRPYFGEKLLIRHVHEYRLHSPWTNEVYEDSLRSAFRLGD